MIAALDTDGDGELSAKEIENATVALKKLDKNNDGKLTTEGALLVAVARAGAAAGVQGGLDEARAGEPKALATAPQVGCAQEARGDISGFARAPGPHGGELACAEPSGAGGAGKAPLVGLARPQSV